MKKLIKDGFSLTKGEFLLSLIVFAYLITSVSILQYPFASTYLLYIQAFFFLLENYITVCVYYGIKSSIWGEEIDVPVIFIKGMKFFGRVLAYKLLAGLFVIFVAAFCMSMVELVKDTAPITAWSITAFTILWLSFPVYVFLLTTFTPLVIITDDIPLFPAIRKSVAFVKGNLLDIEKLVLLFLPLWLVVIFSLKLYNEKGFFLQFVILYLISVLEVITVKVFLLFYRREVG